VVDQGALIGIGGLLYAGKDAVGDYLVDEHDWAKLGMSDSLNLALLTLNPMIPCNVVEGQLVSEGHIRGEFVPYQYLHREIGYVEAKKNPEVRRLLQALGTEVGRELIDNNVWVDMTRRRIRTLRAEGVSVIVTGMRFPNELDMIREEGGELWWVSRPGVEGGNTLTGSHASENSVGAQDFDTIIPNVGTLEDLHLQVRLALHRN
jgi:hypothetical protein